MSRLAFCMEELIITLQSRTVVRLPGSRGIERYINEATEDVYHPCVHNQGDYASDDPARRTYRSRVPPPTLDALLRPHRPLWERDDGRTHL